MTTQHETIRYVFDESPVFTGLLSFTPPKTVNVPSSAVSLFHPSIAVDDAGVTLVAGEGDGIANHAVGFREGKMHVADPVLVSQLYASAEVIDVYFRKTTDTAAVARAIQRRVTQAPVQIHEVAPMTAAELEALDASLVTEVMSALSARFAVGSIHERV